MQRSFRHYVEVISIRYLNGQLFLLNNGTGFCYLCRKSLFYKHCGRFGILQQYSYEFYCFGDCNLLLRVARVVSVLDSGAEGPGFRSQLRRCRVTVLGKLLTPIVPLFKQQNR